MKRFLLTLAILLTVPTGVVQAQEPPSLSTLEISLWPEFDRPEVLVIYRGLFEEGTPLPVPVELRIPVGVGQPTAVAYVGEDGQRFNQQYTSRTEDDWLIVSFELGELGFQLEYYDELPVDSTGQRQYTYSYTADYPVTEMTMELQEPPSAEAISLDPPADSSTTASDGLVYHRLDVGALEQGEEQSWTLAYQKDNSDLTVAMFSQAEPPAPTPAPASGNDSTVLIFLVAFVTLIAVGAAAFWLGGRTQPMSQPTLPGSGGRKRRGSGRGGQPQRQQSAGSDGNDAMFCRQCGTKLRSDSVFCHRCGTPV
jgi:hypothetical protein